ncbi:T9SS type A sorting domain-containing protein [Moheibacter sediminis]|uniref:Por secretion system C-terminal sorting domain-containing protein n=1 Tax=Moheibacter sediminis TaxID=1434700 RepID=A0A1W2CTZ2_9FLAO|nr:T9SS type A sorting domain-containing protein [Moheibacter sediminis]SMC88693.1 Por secretion system C-terminal sorting domain-containing protein [Moheibacter sediminis]
MKKFSILLMGLAFSAGFAQTTITQNTDTTTILTPHAVTCGVQGSYTGYNVISRAFKLDTFGITTDFTVTNVGFGFENITGDLPFALILSTSGGAYPAGALTELMYEPVNISAADSGTILDVELSEAVVVPAGSELVMAFEGDGELDLVSWYPASNDAGQSGPSYLTAPACGLNTPGTYASIGFADVHVIMTVTGTTDMGVVELNSKALSVYPNPATDVINVSLKNGEAQSIEITNLAGQNVYSAKAANSVNVSFLPAGVYVVKVKDINGTTHMSKIVKK